MESPSTPRTSRPQAPESTAAVQLEIAERRRRRPAPRPAPPAPAPPSAARCRAPPFIAADDEGRRRRAAAARGSSSGKCSGGHRRQPPPKRAAIACVAACGQVQPWFGQEAGRQQHEQRQAAEQVFHRPHALDRLRAVRQRAPGSARWKAQSRKPAAATLPSAAATVGSAPKCSMAASSTRCAASNPACRACRRSEKPPIRKAMAMKDALEDRPVRRVRRSACACERRPPSAAAR